VTSSLDELPQAAERRHEFGGRNRHNLEGLMSKTVQGQSQSRVLPARALKGSLLAHNLFHQSDHLGGLDHDFFG
jgi:hypothetical protein